MISSAGADLVRNIFSTIDKAVYSLIGTLYGIIEALAEHELILDNTISNISNKLYSFIGVFMLFKITFSLITYIINPDTIADKEKGGSKLIVNILITFVLIIVTPLGFELLYEAQSAILKEQLIPNIILTDNPGTGHQLYISSLCQSQGYDIITPSTTLDPNTGNMIDDTGEFIAMMTLRPFIQVDTQAIVERPDSVEKFLNGGYCEASNIKELLKESIVNFDDSSSKKLYILDYSFLLSTIVGIIVVLIFAGFCLDAAVRTIKLYFLQIIAPIPIMSYIDPASSKKGLFSKWIKEVGITWADLFLRLTAVYFAIFIISNIQLNANNVMINLLLILGALMFAKKLPDILKKMFNIDLKGDFKLNPIKKFQESSLGGKQIVGAATGALGGAIGGFVGYNAAAMKNNTLKDAVKSFQKGVVTGYKNPGSLKGLSGGLSYLKEKGKNVTEAKEKLKEFDKFNREGEKYFNAAKVLNRNKEPVYKEEIRINPQTGNKERILTNKYEIDETSQFSHPEYISSFKEVKEAKEKVKNAKNDLQYAQSTLARLNANPNATQSEINIANAQVQAKQATLEKAEGILNGKKERHSIIQNMYTDDARIEKSIKEYQDRHPAAAKNENVQDTVVLEILEQVQNVENIPHDNHSLNNEDATVQASDAPSSESEKEEQKMSPMEQSIKNTQEDLANGVDKVYQDSDFATEATINGMKNDEYQASMAGDETLVDKAKKMASLIGDKITKDKTTEDETHYISHINEETMKHYNENGRFDMSSHDMYEEELRRNEEARQKRAQQENTQQNLGKKIVDKFKKSKDE